MDSLKKYFDQYNSDDEEDNFMDCNDNKSSSSINSTINNLNNETNLNNDKSNLNNETNLNNKSNDDLIIKQLINELILKIENQSRKKSTKFKRNLDEISISSDEFSSEESSSDELTSDGNISIDSSDESDDNLRSIRYKPLKTKGELLIDELPPPVEEKIELKLDINELQQIGNVSKIIDNLVIVESFKNLPALDLDSLLFKRDGNSIGRIFDVIGLVVKPNYVIRFSSNEKIQENSIKINMPIYFVPKFNDLTKYVFIAQLKKNKGSDASWEHNNEPPEYVQEYSDDEAEREANLKLKSKRKFNNTDNLDKKLTNKKTNYKFKKQSNYNKMNRK